MFIQVSSFSVGNLWASNGQVERFRKFCVFIFRHLCGFQPHLFGMEPEGRSTGQRHVVGTANDSFSDGSRLPVMRSAVSNIDTVSPSMLRAIAPCRRLNWHYIFGSRPIGCMARRKAPVSSGAFVRRTFQQVSVDVEEWSSVSS